MLSITAISAGAIDYLLKGSGCARHDHESAEPEGAATQPPGAEYLVLSAASEPAGVWFGAGLPMVGMTAGEQARAEDVRAVFGHLRHPTSSEEDPVFLGRAPRTFAAVEERIERAWACEPDAGEERRQELANQVRGDRRKAVGYYDLTFSPVKSVSVYWAALMSQGRHAEAELVVQAHREAVAEAMAWTEGEVAWTRVGYHGRTSSGRSVGEYEQASGLVWTRWDHSTNRACEPQLHSHVAVLNRVITASDGQIRALDGRGFRAVKHGVDAIYAQSYERHLSESLGVRFEWRPDGQARELVGIDRQLLTEASSRRADVVEGAEKLIAEYQQRHGHQPSPAVRTRLTRAAALSTRAAKSQLAPLEQIRRWSVPRTARLGQSVAEVEHHGDHAARVGHRDQRNQPTRALDDVLAAAVAAVQERHATWDMGLLQKSIADELTRAPFAVDRPLPDLTALVLADPVRFGIVQVSASDPVPVPAELRRADGKSRYRPHHDERYTTTTQLGVETAIVHAARASGAPALDPHTAIGLRRELDSAGLTRDQVAAVVGIVSSGRAADVLIGPAGTGKSHTVGVLAQTWRREIGGRVLGLATSQIAAMELADNGLDAMNTTRFLTSFTDPRDTGNRVRPGDLIVLDEVGMTGTAELAQIADVVAAAGGKLLYTGDQEQLAAIGAGGMLNLLVIDNGCYTLTEIHRFTHDWERAASVGLRVGNAGILDVYERHGRLVGGAIEDVVETALRAYLADTVTGHQSLLVVASNHQATELSGRIRDELVHLGRVDPQVLCTTRDGNPMGSGDLIQARRNDSTIRVGGGGMVTNRLTYRVRGRDHDSGVLQVEDRHGRIAHLPSDYVSEHVTLAYASTVYAAQGRTVDTCHAVIEPGCDRRSAYVALTRGRESNTAYVVCERDPDGHLPERLASTARAQMAVAVATVDDGSAEPAELARRAGIDEGRSLAWVVTQWDLVAGEACRDHCTALLSELLDPSSARVLLAEPGYPRLVRAVRDAELAGHDSARVLAGALRSRSLVGAESMSDVLRWRISIAIASRVPERDPAVSWMAMTPRCGGPVGEYLTALAAAADERQHELARRAVTHQPAWATTCLGPPPARELDRGEWVRRAGILAAYRDLRALPDDVVALGPAPPREQVLHRALWKNAHTAAGAPSDQLYYATATDRQLRQLRAAYQRELAWAPHWVHDELRDAQLAAVGYEQDAALYQAEAQMMPLGSTERARADVDVHSVLQLAAVYRARVGHLTVIDAARRQWHQDTATARTGYERAGDELTRRGLTRDLSPEPSEQPQLFDTDALLSRAGTRYERSARTTSTTTVDRTPRDQQQTLLALTVDARDIAAAQPLRASGIYASEDSTTLADARRHAEISINRRDQRAGWAATVEQLVSEPEGVDEHEDYGHDHGHDHEIDRSRDQDQDLDQGVDY